MNNDNPLPARDRLIAAMLNALQAWMVSAQKLLVGSGFEQGCPLASIALESTPDDADIRTRAHHAARQRWFLPNHHRVARFYTIATGAGWHGWKHWCQFPRYFFDDPAMPQVAGLFDTVTTPIVAANATDDLWAPPASRDAFMAAYRSAPCVRMGYFRRQAQPLWENALQWFAEHPRLGGSGVNPSTTTP